MDIQPVDEEQLIKACIRSEAWAQRKIYDMHASKMMGVCIRFVNNRETARDLLQDGFIRLFTRIHTYSATGSFNGWVRRIFVTISLEYLRQNDALKLSTSIDEYNDFIQDLDSSVLEQISADDLMGFIRELPNGFRTIFNLHAIEGYSHVEIAEMLQINEGTSRSQFARARKILQQNVQSLMK